MTATFVRFGSLMMRVEDIRYVTELQPEPFVRSVMMDDGSTRVEEYMRPLRCEICRADNGSLFYVHESLDYVQAKIAEALGK